MAAAATAAVMSALLLLSASVAVDASESTTTAASPATTAAPPPPPFHGAFVERPTAAFMAVVGVAVLAGLLASAVFHFGIQRRIGIRERYDLQSYAPSRASRASPIRASMVTGF